MRLRVRCLLSIVAFTAVVAPLRAQAPQAGSLAVQVNGAIDRGVACLKSQQKKDGTFPCDHWCGVGSTALSTYALLKSGVPASDPAIQKSITWLRYQPFEHTYAVSVEIAALDAYCSAADRSVQSQILDAAKWLEEHQRDGRNGREDGKDAAGDEGLWAYPGREVDLSNSQYAVLGLWVAERHGFKSKRETWGRLLKALARRQNDDGGFGYHEGDVSTGSMTTAGLAMLMLALERVADDARYGLAREKGRASLARGWKWLETFFTVDGNPHGDRTIVPVMQLYYLFGLERVASIGDKKKIGAHDWYTEGATRILRMQRPAGNWNDCDGTSLALLFLRRATLTGMHDEADDASGARDGASAAKPTPPAGSSGARRPLPAVPFLKRWFVCGPIPDPKDELLEKEYAGEEKLAPKVGAQYRGKTWQERRELDDFVGFDAKGSGRSDDRPGERVLCHAFTWLHVTPTSGDATEAVLWVGSDDGVRVLLDGKPLLTRHVHGAGDRDQVSAPVNLAAGVHRLLVKVENDQARCGFYLRFAHADGTAATEIRPSLDATEPELAATALAMPGLFTFEELRANLPLMSKPMIGFDSEKELELVAFDRVSDFEDARHWPRWLDATESKPGNPHPGARGILNVHPLREPIPARLFLRTTLPAAGAAPTSFVVRVSEEPYAPKGRGDFVLRLGAFVDELVWLTETVVGSSSPPDAAQWRTVEASLSTLAAKHPGQDVLLVIEVAAGGAEAFTCEHAYFDEIAVR